MKATLSSIYLFFRKYVMPVVFGLAVVAFIGHVIWKQSGSNEWTAMKEEDGIKVSSMKVPGDTLLKYKINTRVNASLADVVAYITDVNTASDLGIENLKRVEKITGDPLFVAYDAYDIELPPPFGKREVVIQLQYAQDPETKVVDVNILAAPHMTPRKGDTPRMQYLSNQWRLTPLKDGGVNIEAISEVDFQIPYFIANAVLADVITEQFTIMKNLLKEDRYHHRTVAFIEEPAAT